MPAKDVTKLDQDQEYCDIEVDGETRRIRFHDYDEIYAVPGLYERLFAEELSCNSPKVVSELLSDELKRAGADPAGLTVLDFGAGNGMVAEELDRIGTGSIVGVDLLEGARDAAERDRPGLYENYHAVDMTALEAGDRQSLEDHDFNCLTCVAALGFGDVPPEAFATAFNFVASPGWVAFNLRERFTEDGDRTGFSGLLDRMLDDGTLVERARVRYTHRRSVNGDELPYIAMVAEKTADVTLDWGA